jgi:membrane protein required for colicin V production
MDDQIPDDAPGWIVNRYEQMVRGCTATGETVAPEASPQPSPESTAPASN